MASASATVEGVALAMPKESFEISGPIDPTKFYPKYGPLPAVVAVREQTGSWDAVGRTRRLMLSDGGHVIETIAVVDSPRYFAYNLTEFQQLFGMLVTDATAQWRYDRVATGTKVTWTYTFRPKRGASLIVAGIVRFWWAPYMKKVLPPILREIERRSTMKPA